MFRKHLAMAVSALAMLATASQSVAGGRAVECYERYHTAPVYDRIDGIAQVNPGYSRVETIPPIIGTRTRDVLVRPGRIKHRTVPAVYSYETERVLVEPARTVKRLVSGRGEIRYKTVKVSDGGYSWEWRWIDGRKVLCKVKNKARYERIAYTVQGPSHYVHERVPAQYEYRKRKVLVQAESTESYVLAPEYETIRDQVVIQPKQHRVIDIPPSYQWVTRKVLVSEGAEGWQRVRIPRHCAY
ncbi:hypothetical protein [Mesorhizobium sp. BE184]|uniref:hypothetical protein n=1 Tax=Mesorhizobium sp. BE184 TaxID=2817714 RepID=UPI002865E78C|nr:hypothetical protein [Mesorhizobium sp. BE184]MDR7031854.1 hypothetical protein [Mesorhizobium sp. BE184]